jgi:hypothetical protein
MFPLKTLVAASVVGVILSPGVQRSLHLDQMTMAQNAPDRVPFHRAVHGPVSATLRRPSSAEFAAGSHPQL